jgi:hypothetical protein
MRIGSFIGHKPGGFSGALWLYVSLIVALTGGCKPADDPTCGGGVACTQGQRCVVDEEDVAGGGIEVVFKEAGTRGTHGFEERSAGDL